VLGLRFSADKACPAERFQTLRRVLGDAFEGIEIDSSPGNTYGIPAARGAFAGLPEHALRYQERLHVDDDDAAAFADGPWRPKT
jgi:hypothetical protein